MSPPWGGGSRFLLSMVKVPSAGQPRAGQPVSLLASAWVTKDLGEVNEQFSEVWSRVGLVVAEVRVPGCSQAAMPCRSWEAASLTRH